MKWQVARPQTRRAESYPFERPLLHACSNNGTFLGDVRLDIRKLPNIDVRGNVTKLPFKDDSFASAFTDYPWVASFKKEIAGMMHELLRVAPVVYTLGPYTWGCSGFRRDWVEVPEAPGVNPPLLFARYVRSPV